MEKTKTEKTNSTENFQITSELFSAVFEEEYVDLLQVANITKIEDLAKLDPQALIKILTDVNLQVKLVRKLPSSDKVKDWIEKSQSIVSVQEQKGRFEKYRIINFNNPSIDLMLSVQFLSENIVPFIFAIDRFGKVINEINKTEHQQVLIQSITKYSPVTISISGIAETFHFFRDIISPWRRNHLKEVAELDKEQKRLEIELLKIQILEKRMETSSRRINLEKARETTRQLQIQNKEKEFNLQCKKIALCTGIIKNCSENVSPEQISFYASKMMPLIDEIISSNLDIKIENIR